MAGGGLFDDSGGGIGGLLTGLGGATGINLSGIPFVGGMFPNPAEAQMRQAMANATASYGAMREPAAQGYQNLMARTSAAYAPVQSALGWMYGAPQQSSPSAGTAPSPGPSSQAQAPLSPSQSGGGGGFGLGGLARDAAFGGLGGLSLQGGAMLDQAVPYGPLRSGAFGGLGSLGLTGAGMVNKVFG